MLLARFEGVRRLVEGFPEARRGEDRDGVGARRGGAEGEKRRGEREAQG